MFELVTQLRKFSKYHPQYFVDSTDVAVIGVCWFAGSSVATSLCAGEAVKKYVGLLEVKEGEVMRMNSLELKTVRPFVFEVILRHTFLII